MVFFRKKDRKGITNVEKINCSTCHSFENYSVSPCDKVKYIDFKIGFYIINLK